LFRNSIVTRQGANVKGNSEKLTAKKEKAGKTKNQWMRVSIG
jgi:hypothetical protein